MKSLSIICLAFILFSFHGVAQIFEQPIFSLTSHPTLEIISVERWEDRMVLNLSLKNERFSASFCIDSNTVLKNSLGDEQYKLLSMEGIPSCPDTYRFNSVGERIAFSLAFQPVPDEVIYIDLLENCEENCVNLKYVLLDEDLNTQLKEGFHLYELGRPKAALQAFEEIMSTEYDGVSPAFGTVYLYLISIHYELGSSKDARRVYQELRESNIIGRDEFIKTAKETGIVR